MAYSSVEAKSIQELCKVIDCEHKTAPYVEKSDYLVVRTSNVRNGRMVMEDMKYTTLEGFKAWTQRAVPEDGDVLFTREAPAGESCLVPKDKNVCMGQRMVMLRPNREKVDPIFLSLVLATEKSKFDILRLSIGSTVSRINIADIKKLRIAAPPLLEQRKVAQIFSSWDKAIATTEQLLTNSQRQKKAVMQQLLTGRKRLSGFDEVWTHSNLKLIVTFSKGQQINRNTLTSLGEFPVINGGVGPSGYTSQYNGLPNTITISEGGNSCGYVSFQKEHFWCGGHCYALTNLNVDVEFMYHLLKFNETKIMRLRVGSGLPNIQKKDLEAFSIYYPLNMHEQQKIANILSVLDQETEVLQQKLHYLKQEKKALMQQLLTGKRRVKVEAA
ncbi:type I restriction enzyme S subunit [Pantoea agglomerans]